GRPGRRRRARLPLTIRYGLPLVVIAWPLWAFFEARAAQTARLAFVGAEGQPVEGEVVVELFPEERAHAAPSPPPVLGEFVATGELALRSALPADSVLVRVRGADGAVTFGHMTRGTTERVVLAPPRA